MKIANGFVLKKINGVNTVIALGNATKTLNGMLVLNETATFLWENLQNGLNKQQLIDMLLQNYEVTNEQAEKNVSEFIKKLSDLKIIETNEK